VPFGDLKLFKEIAATRSMSKGAAHVGVSQSAASQHVQELERNLGVVLLDRSKRPMELTPAGKVYYEFCRDVLQREEELVLELGSVRKAVESSLRVASIYSIGLSEMSRLQEAFTVRYPAIQLQVEYMRPEKVYEAVINGTADLGLVSYPQASREITAIPWRDEEMQVAVPPTHPFARRHEVYPADLGGQNFVGFDEDLTIRRELDRFFKVQGVDVNPSLHFDNIHTIKEAVVLGTGISVLPARTMQAEIAEGRMVAVRLHAPGLVRPVGVVHRKKKKLNRAAEAFLELLLDQRAAKEESKVGAPASSRC
jgi:LysR family transcriptional regulator, transcriptional activator of the cysJI operon